MYITVNILAPDFSEKNCGNICMFSWIRQLFTFISSYARSQNCEKRLLASSCYVMSVCLCVRQHETTWFPLEGFSWKLLLSIFRKSVDRIGSFIQNPTRITDNLVYICDTFSLILLRMRNITENACRENQNTHFMFSNFNVEKYGRARQATDGDTAHAYCMLDT